MPTAACDIANKRYLIQCLRIVPSLRNPNRKEVLKMDNIVSIAPRMMTVKQLSAQTIGTLEYDLIKLQYILNFDSVLFHHYKCIFLCNHVEK